MSFVTLYKELVENINAESNHIEIFQQANYQWLQNIVDALKLQEVKVSRKSLCPVPEITPEPMIADVPEEMFDDSCEVVDGEDSALSTINQIDGETAVSLMSIDSYGTSEFQTERSSLNSTGSTIYSTCDSECFERSREFLEDEEEDHLEETDAVEMEPEEEEEIVETQNLTMQYQSATEHIEEIEEIEDIPVEEEEEVLDTIPQAESNITIPNEEIPSEQSSKSSIVFADIGLLDDSDSDPIECETPTKSGIRFVDAGDLRMSLDPSSLPFLKSSAKPSLSEQLSELSASAAQFRLKWHDLVKEKNQQEKDVVALTDNEEPYCMSDCNDEDADYSDEDDEVYDENAEEIHGKKIPSWARGAKLEEELQKQKSVDPDSIFPELSMTCQLGNVFNSVNPKWNKRTESTLWDQDGVTPEEALRFKQMLGFV